MPAAGAAAGRGLDSARVTTRTQSDFWTELRASLVAIVGTGDGRSVVISPQSGVVVVRALPAELRGIEQYLRATRISVERQVMLEAKIIDVQLNSGYQSGINWALLNHNLAVGQVGNQTSLTKNGQTSGGLAALPEVSLSTPVAGAGSAATTAALLAANPGAALFGLALQTQNFAALIQFLETQGKAQVLSSPRVATLNNQKAVLKVGTDEYFVTNIQAATTVATAVGTTSGTPVPTVTVQPFFSGIVLDVTPQIDENDQIILHIHPSVSLVTTDNKVIDLGVAGSLTLPLAKSNVSEADTVVRVSDGNIVALGGLMKLDLEDNRGGLPGTGNNAIGNFFRNANTQLVKKEMVILIKPTIIQEPAAGMGTLSRRVSASKGWARRRLLQNRGLTRGELRHLLWAARAAVRHNPRHEFLLRLPQHPGGAEHAAGRGLQRRGFIKITGEVGTGKTLLCRKFLATLDSGWVSAYIPNPTLEPRGLLLAIAEELGVTIDVYADQHRLLKGITKCLLDLARLRKRSYSAWTSARRCRSRRWRRSGC